MRDKTSFGNILINVYNSNLFGKNEWRPGFENQRVNGHVFWSMNHGGREWLQGKTQIINKLIQLYSYKSYLEIGGQPWSEGSTCAKIMCDSKHTVDPNKREGDFPRASGDSGVHFGLLSDDFFEQNPDKRYDIVFIDGYHEHHQVMRDIENSLSVLSDGGVIILHDMVPLTRDLEISPLNAGTCWRAFADLRATREDLEMNTLVPPWGTEDSLGIIRKGSQKLFDRPITYSYEFLLENIDALMSLIDLDEFYKVYVDPKVNLSQEK
jgi:hypothetical protein